MIDGSLKENIINHEEYILFNINIICFYYQYFFSTE